MAVMTLHCRQVMERKPDFASQKRELWGSILLTSIPTLYCGMGTCATSGAGLAPSLSHVAHCALPLLGATLAGEGEGVSGPSPFSPSLSVTPGVTWLGPAPMPSLQHLLLRCTSSLLRPGLAPLSAHGLKSFHRVLQFRDILMLEPAGCHDAPQGVSQDSGLAGENKGKGRGHPRQGGVWGGLHLLSFDFPPLEIPLS